MNSENSPKYLNEYKSMTMQICDRKGWSDVSIEYIWMFLVEEVGELASAIRRHQKQFPDRKKINIEGEIMDVLSYLFQISHILDIDLDEGWKNFIEKKKEKKEEECV